MNDLKSCQEVSTTVGVPNWMLLLSATPKLSLAFYKTPLHTSANLERRIGFFQIRKGRRCVNIVKVWEEVIILLEQIVEVYVLKFLGHLILNVHKSDNWGIIISECSLAAIIIYDQSKINHSGEALDNIHSFFYVPLFKVQSEITNLWRRRFQEPAMPSYSVIRSYCCIPCIQYPQPDWSRHWTPSKYYGGAEYTSWERLPEIRGRLEEFREEGV